MLPNDATQFWTREQVMRSFNAVFQKRKFFSKTSEELGWKQGYIVLDMDEEYGECPFVTDEVEPSRELNLILKRSGWKFLVESSDYAVLYPGNEEIPDAETIRDN